MLKETFSYRLLLSNYIVICLVMIVLRSLPTFIVMFRGMVAGKWVLLLCRYKPLCSGACACSRKAVKGNCDVNLTSFYCNFKAILFGLYVF